jgi:hypothetical protein
MKVFIVVPEGSDDEYGRPVAAFRSEEKAQEFADHRMEQDLVWESDRIVELELQ